MADIQEILNRVFDSTNVALKLSTITSSQVSDFNAAVQALVNQFDSRNAVVYATAAALATNTYANGTAGVGATLTATANGALSVDGQAVATGQRILVQNEATGANNGIYTVTQTGTVAVAPYILTRATDFDQAAEMGPGILVPVEAPTGVTGGTANNQKVFLSLGPSPFVVGTSAITFALIGATYTAGTGLTLTGTAFSANYGTTSSTAAVGNDGRFTIGQQVTPNTVATDSATTSVTNAWKAATNTPTLTLPNDGFTYRVQYVCSGISVGSNAGGHSIILTTGDGTSATGRIAHVKVYVASITNVHSVPTLTAEVVASGQTIIVALFGVAAGNTVTLEQSNAGAPGRMSATRIA